MNKVWVSYYTLSETTSFPIVTFVLSFAPHPSAHSYQIWSLGSSVLLVSIY